MSKNIVLEGWLTKSPPTKRIWRAKWRRRWFALRQSVELPGQYFLDYYADRNCRRRKGTINLDLCEQVDAGLHMKRSGTCSPKLRGSVFTVKTSSRTYHLEADCEADMEKWVDAICRVCGLRATEESANALGKYQSNISGATSEQPELADGHGPYIPISECITGVRDPLNTFTFNPKNVATSRTLERVPPSQHYTSHPHIRLNNSEFSENDSNMSEEDECKSLNNSQSNIGQDWSVAKTFTKLSISPKPNGVSDGEGPPVPPRPPKTLTMGRETFREPFYGPKILEPMESDNVAIPPWLRTSGRSSTSNFGSPARCFTVNRNASHIKYMDEEEELMHPNNSSLLYCNLSSLPPAVDRALKPRPSSHSVSHIHSLFNNHNHSLLPHGANQNEDAKADGLQYLDLDLHVTKPINIKPQEVPKKIEINHGKSLSSVEARSEYKTVDFLKTEAFKITRQDAEALRNTPI